MTERAFKVGDWVAFKDTFRDGVDKNRGVISGETVTYGEWTYNKIHWEDGSIGDFLLSADNSQLILV